MSKNNNFISVNATEIHSLASEHIYATFPDSLRFKLLVRDDLQTKNVTKRAPKLWGGGEQRGKEV